MNWAETTGLQSPEDDKILCGLSMSPHLKIFSQGNLYIMTSRYFLYFTMAEVILTASEGV